MADGVPDLSTLGIEAVDAGVCEDTFDNRRLLREHKLGWKSVPPGEDGAPSGLLEVFRRADPEVGPSTQRASYEKFRDLLVDEKDAWSDYVDPRSLPIESSAPHWVYRRAEAWREWDERARLTGSRKAREPHLPTRCTTIKSDGARCWAWAVDAANEGRCRAHAPGAALAANMGHQIALAKVKVMQAMPAMVDELEGLALGAASEQVRLKAITEMMDRGGVNSSTDVNVTGGITVEQDPGVAIRERLAELAARLAPKAVEHAAEPPGEILEAEVVSDTEESA